MTEYCRVAITGFQKIACVVICCVQKTGRGSTQQQPCIWCRRGRGNSVVTVSDDTVVTVSDDTLQDTSGKTLKAFVLSSVTFLSAVTILTRLEHLIRQQSHFPKHPKHLTWRQSHFQSSSSISIVLSRIPWNTYNV